MNALTRYLSMSIFALVTVIGSAHLVGCNTTEGVGRDIENAGDKIEDAADDAAD